MDQKKIKAHSDTQSALGLIQGIACGLLPNDSDALEAAVEMIEKATEVLKA